MYLNELKLTNFRGSKDLQLLLDKKLNVFVGINGSGKSTVLDAVAILLSWIVNRIKNTSASGRPITERDIRNGEFSANLEVTCAYQHRAFFWNVAKVRKGHKKKGVASSLMAMTEMAKVLQDKISQHPEEVNLPLFVYYPVNRSVLDIPLRIRNRHSFDLFSAFDDALTSGANFRTFFEWFREREDLENEKYRHADKSVESQGDQFSDRQLKVVREALAEFMPNFTNITVRRNPLRMEVLKNGDCMSVDQLSDGEKCLMALVGDLARRLAIANPVNPKPLEGEGVVLIDEVDLHLHPKWQRMIVPQLTTVFPNCQFILSTHSPHVITHVKHQSLHLLNFDKDKGMLGEQPIESYGKSVDRVLEDLMGLTTTRPDEVSVQLDAIYDEISHGKLELAQSHIAKLQQKIGGDPDLVKASVLIKRRALFGK